MDIDKLESRETKKAKKEKATISYNSSDRKQAKWGAKSQGEKASTEEPKIPKELIITLERFIK